MKNMIVAYDNERHIGIEQNFLEEIVLTRIGFTAVEGFQVVRSLEEAYDIAKEEIWVIGGSKIYETALADVEKIYATEIDVTVVGDVSFPELPGDQWVETSREFHQIDERNIFPYSFVTFDRK